VSHLIASENVSQKPTYTRCERERERELAAVQEELLVVADRGKDVLVLRVPRGILDHAAVAHELLECVQDARLGVVGVDVPHADAAVVGGREQVAVPEVAPREAVALLGVALEPQLRVAKVVARLRGMLGVVEHVHVGRHLLASHT